MPPGAQELLAKGPQGTGSSSRPLDSAFPPPRQTRELEEQGPAAGEVWLSPACPHAGPTQIQTLQGQPLLPLALASLRLPAGKQCILGDRYCWSSHGSFSTQNPRPLEALAPCPAQAFQDPYLLIHLPNCAKLTQHHQ